jgi:hypothetical protein
MILFLSIRGVYVVIGPSQEKPWCITQHVEMSAVMSAQRKFHKHYTKDPSQQKRQRDASASNGVPFIPESLMKICCRFDTLELFGVGE